MSNKRLVSHLRFSDVLWNSTIGLRVRRTRTLMTAAGIAVGIGALVAVIGISASSRAGLLAELDQLGTNLLRVAPGQTVLGQAATLPEEAPAMVRRIGPVETASAVTQLPTSVRRNDAISPARTGGIAVMATEPDLITTLQATLTIGRFHDTTPPDLPTVVLGSVAAQRLGITSLTGAPLVIINGQWFAVVGVLDTLALAPEIDRAALVTYAVAESLITSDLEPTTIYIRTHPDRVNQVRDVLPATINPIAPNEVAISRPSDALEARAATDDALTALLLGVGAVALIVGGLGIANVMIISVLERRTEIGIRRAIGATRAHIRRQFVTESILLAAIGGTTGVTTGALVTAIYASNRDWLVNIPTQALAAGIGISLLIGALAGLYPANQAAKLQPAQAVHATN